ncbi:unnamed protein product, partial [Ectocarpus sp. 12 AP-2014]
INLVQAIRCLPGVGIFSRCFFFSLSLPYTYVFRGRPGREFRDHESIFFHHLALRPLLICRYYFLSRPPPICLGRPVHALRGRWCCQCAGGGGECRAASTRRDRRCAGWLCWALGGCSAGPRLLSGE